MHVDVSYTKRWIDYDVVNWVHLAWDRVNQQILVFAVMTKEELLSSRM
jgi:hypothetical protein